MSGAQRVLQQASEWMSGTGAKASEGVETAQGKASESASAAQV